MDFGNGGTAAGARSDKAATALSEISVMQALTTSAVGRRSPDSVSKTAFSKTGKFAERVLFSQWINPFSISSGRAGGFRIGRTGSFGSPETTCTIFIGKKSFISHVSFFHIRLKLFFSEEFPESVFGDFPYGSPKGVLTFWIFCIGEDFADNLARKVFRVRFVVKAGKGISIDGGKIF